eukprot:gene8058-8707_t
MPGQQPRQWRAREAVYRAAVPTAAWDPPAVLLELSEVLDACAVLGMHVDETRCKAQLIVELRALV